MRQPFTAYNVIPGLPPELEHLQELAYNFWWNWHHEAVDLFRQIAPDLWETTLQNPVLMLEMVGGKRLKELAKNDEFLTNLESVCQKFNAYMNDKQTWYQRTHQTAEDTCIAYFSPEVGLAKCLPIYAGGLGLLAGDHLKSASDLGLPLVGVSLLYQEGYFNQYLRSNGQQEEVYPSNDFYNIPIQWQRQEDGTPVTISLLCSTREIAVQVWRAQVGRIPLFLLSTNVPANSARDRNITNRLYNHDLEARLCQEIVLGIGGMRALVAMGISPTVYHLNEGHAALAALERISLMISQCGLSFAQAQEAVLASTVFTTHTSVSAATDKFSAQLIDKYFRGYYSSLGLSRKNFLSLARENPADEKEPFTMPALAFRLSGRVTAVSNLHGEVSRRIWHNIWPKLPEEEVPIGSLTNGIHLPSWVAPDSVAILFNRYLGESWQADSANAEVWQKVDDIPDEELWKAHEERREHLVAVVRQRLYDMLAQQDAPQFEIALANSALNPKALTICFARRFTEYKRPTLILHHQETLVRLLTDRNRPIQIIFAGKSHPADEIGKEAIQRIFQFVRQNGLHRQVIFLENYDIAIASLLVQGSDLWLNTPRRPFEACGTSGMKAAANGVLNLSILDGWWPEAYQPGIGWAIGTGEEYEDQNYQDEVDAKSCYDLLEHEIIPLFNDRDSNGLPQKWIGRMKAAIRTICPKFNSTRMIHEYCERFYLPASEQYRKLGIQQCQEGDSGR